MKILQFIIFTLLVFEVNGQTFEPEPKDWSTGHIILSNGDRLSGKIFYRELKQTVYFGQEDELRALKAMKVLNFDFYDSAKRTVRTFVSVPFKRTPTSPEVTEFMEVVRKYEKFMLLSVSYARKVTIPRNKYVASRTINEIIVHWYLLDDDGIEPLYFSFVRRDVFGPKVEFFNQALYKKIVDPYQNEIKRFSLENKLKPEKPQDNLELLDLANTMGKQNEEFKELPEY